jgi:hypothetical protein
LAIEGIASVCIVAVANEFTQLPLEITHFKIVVPGVNPVTAVVGVFGEAITPLPEIILHVPTPTNGVFPNKVVLGVDTQSVCEGFEITAVVGI